MTTNEYKLARLTLKLSTKEWLDKLGIAEITHKRYSSGARDIPLYIQRHIETLTKGA